MYKLTLVSLFSFIFLSLCAQKITPTVIASAGNYQKSGSFSLEWTLGEWQTESLSSNNSKLTQGFHQTNLTLVAVNNPFIAGIDIYPNPVLDQLILNNETGQSIKVHLLGLNGVCIASKQFDAGQSEWEMEHLNSGLYILQIEQDGIKANYKLEKLK